MRHRLHALSAALVSSISKSVIIGNCEKSHPIDWIATTPVEYCARDEPDVLCTIIRSHQTLNVMMHISTHRCIASFSLLLLFQWEISCDSAAAFGSMALARSDVRPNQIGQHFRWSCFDIEHEMGFRRYVVAREKKIHNVTAWEMRLSSTPLECSDMHLVDRSDSIQTNKSTAIDLKYSQRFSLN